MTPILPKQQWINKQHGYEVRVMAVVDGSVMARYKGAYPWIRHVKEFLELFEPKVAVG